MPQKTKNNEGLGRAIINAKFGGKAGKMKDMGGASKRRRNGDGSERYTTETKEASWVKMRSITEQQALDEFLSTAELADTDFTAEKMNIKVIHSDQKNPYLLSPDEESSTLRKHRANAGKLTVPRRPHWDDKTTPDELDKAERDSFLEWRRGLAELQENNDLLLTPFERNIEVWRQLWRVIERSDLIVQIVDARNPLAFRSEDLEHYVKEIDENKNNLLLVNKADMMTVKQRKAWADYFEEEGIQFRFFSAVLAAQQQAEEEDYEDYEDGQGIIRKEEEREDEEEYEEEEADKAEEQVAEKAVAEKNETGSEETDAQEPPTTQESIENELDKLALHAKKDGENEDVEQEEEEINDDEDDPLVRILTVDELEALFLEHAPDINQPDPEAPRKVNIGLVGYPNVGKSSTINALVGAKKVSVSATPGKTKHFQTIHLSPRVMLVDCPGLVFPNFATTKAELVCNGVLPIDQLREFTGPVALVAQRIPHSFLEALYGIKINVRPAEEGGTGVPTASEVLNAYAKARGFSTTGTGKNWDESRAARYILKDYISGKLLFCHPPPAEPPYDPHEFNRELCDISRLPEKRRRAMSGDLSVLSAGATPSIASSSMSDVSSLAPYVEKGAKATDLDRKFFKKAGNGGHSKTPFQYVGGNAGKELSGRKARTMAALEQGFDPTEIALGKRHFKPKREKRRTNALDD